MRFALVRLMAVVLAVTGLAQADVYEVDSAHSSIRFTVTHLQFSEVEGRFNDFTGTVDWNSEDVRQSQVNFTVKAKSIDTGNQRRDNHLRGKDFFDTATYPEITFKSTKIRKVSDTKAEITGNLTLHGVTKEIQVPASFRGPADLFEDGNLSVAFKVPFKINRIDYGVGAGWKGGSDKVVSHEVFINMNVQAHQPE